MEDKEILKMYADCGMNVKKTSERLYASTGTIQYHLNKIMRNTGINPRSFWGLIDLLKMYGIERQTNGQAIIS